MKVLRDQRGESVVTFSLLMIPLAALMGLMITISMLIYANIVVIDATRDGARHKALNLDSVTGETTDQVVRRSIGFARLPSAGTAVSVGVEEDANYVTVTTRYLQPVIILRLPELFGAAPYGNAFPIEYRATFKREKT